MINIGQKVSELKRQIEMQLPKEKRGQFLSLIAKLENSAKERDSKSCMDVITKCRELCQ